MYKHQELSYAQIVHVITTLIYTENAVHTEKVSNNIGN